MYLTYTPPIDWGGLLGFLRLRALRGIEAVDEHSYARTIELSGAVGWIRVMRAKAHDALHLEVSSALAAAAPSLLPRLRALFDLDAQPAEILAVLGQDTLLGPAIRANPGLRVPGAFDGFELAVRAILGQQITVRAAATIGGRFAEAFGKPIDTPHEGLTRLTPRAELVAGARIEDIASLGIIRARARSIIAVATECARGNLRLEPGSDATDTINRLLALPGIGPWTAQYIAMRALRLADAFPKEDIALRKKLGGMTAGDAEARSQAWRPYRSYATLHLWHLD